MTPFRMASCLLPSICALLIAGASHAQQTATSSSASVSASGCCREQLGFASHLAAEGDYFRAIGEYKRFLYVCPGDTNRADAAYQVGRCYFQAGRYGDVLEWRNTAQLDSRRSTEASLLVGHALFRLTTYYRALAELEPLTRSDSGMQSANQARYLAGLSLVRLDRGPEAVPLFLAVEESSPYWSKARGYAQALESNRPVPRKSPVLGGTLAVVPGLGYAYAEHFGTALAALVVNGLLWWATLDAFDDGHEAAGATYSIFAVGFYLGNIVGTVQSVDRYNAYQAEFYRSQFPE